MIKKLKIFVVIATLSFLLIGCRSSNNGLNIMNISDMNIDNLIKYSNSFVGDNSKVGSILLKLPGSPMIKSFSIEGYNLNVDYGIKASSNINEDEFAEFWLNKDRIEKIFLNNATTLLILIDNVEEITLKLFVNTSTHTFSISRKELEDYYKVELKSLAKNKNLWNSKVMGNQLNKTENLKQFFSIYPIINE